MAEHSTIEWTDATWNPVTGCSVVSPGCTNCYAMRLAGTRLKHHPSRQGLTRDTKAGPVWTGHVRLNRAWLDQPLRWARPRKIFVCAHGDLFAEDVPDDWIDRVFAVMALCPQHIFQVLTKRSARMRAYCDDAFTPERVWMHFGLIAREFPDQAADCLGHYPTLGRHCAENMERVFYKSGQPKPITGRHALGWPLRNIWLGVSTEDQRRANERVPDLLATPAAIRFVSAEPLIGLIEFSQWLSPSILHCDSGHVTEPVGLAHLSFRQDPGQAFVTPLCTECGADTKAEIAPGIDQIIVGGESGLRARPMHPDWARSIRDQCAAAGVAFFFKQWGEWGQTHPKRPRAVPTVMADDGTLYAATDLAYPDGPRYGEAIRASHDRARLTNIYRVGKKAAGRFLDGVEHNGMPQVAAATGVA